jgi:hypothetical protein
MTNKLIDLGTVRTYRADDLVLRAVEASSAGDRDLARQLMAEARERLRGIPQGPRRSGLLRTLRILKKFLA